MKAEPTSSTARIPTGLSGLSVERSTASEGIAVKKAILKTPRFVTAACWHGYEILEGLLPDLKSSQIALAAATSPKTQRRFFDFLELQEGDESSCGIIASPKPRFQNVSNNGDVLSTRSTVRHIY